jgi:hypothetical protein
LRSIEYRQIQLVEHADEQQPIGEDQFVAGPDADNQFFSDQ